MFKPGEGGPTQVANGINLRGNYRKRIKENPGNLPVHLEVYSCQMWPEPAGVEKNTGRSFSEGTV